MSSATVSPLLRERYRLLHATDPDAAREAAAAAAQGGPLVAVSACLVGIACRYDGGHCHRPELVSRFPPAALLPLCPEVLAGLGVPRPPSWFSDDGAGDAVLSGAARLWNEQGHDVTLQFRAGADTALGLALAAGATTAHLKERSPMCGVHRVHRGTQLVPGRGLFAALLARHGIVLQSDDEPV